MAPAPISASAVAFGRVENFQNPADNVSACGPSLLPLLGTGAPPVTVLTSGGSRVSPSAPLPSATLLSVFVGSSGLASPMSSGGRAASFTDMAAFEASLHGLLVLVLGLRVLGKLPL